MTDAIAVVMCIPLAIVVSGLVMALGRIVTAKIGKVSR